jgi:hypothetical protein
MNADPNLKKKRQMATGTKEGQRRRVFQIPRESDQISFNTAPGKMGLLPMNGVQARRLHHNGLPSWSWRAVVVRPSRLQPPIRWPIGRRYIARLGQ